MESYRTTLVENRERLQKPVRIITFIAHESAAGFSANNGAMLGNKNKAGGAAVVAEMQTRSLRAMGINATILSPRPQAIDAPKDEFHNYHTTITKEEILKNPLYNPEFVAEVLSNVENADIIYAHYPTAGIVIAELKKEGKIKPETKFVYMGHTWEKIVNKSNSDRRRSASYERYRAEQGILETADIIVTGTNTERANIARTYFSPHLTETDIRNKIRVVPLGIDTNEFNPEKRAERRKEVREEFLGDLSSSLNFFIHGRFDSLKGQLSAVRGFCDALRKDPSLDISLSLIGGPFEGEYYEKIKDYLSTQPDEIKNRVLLFGPKSALDSIAAGDVFLGASSTESWYLSATEAMACGVPTILSDIDTLWDVAGYYTFYVTPPENGESDTTKITDAIVAMATNESYRNACGEYNYQRASQYTWERSATALADVFDELTESKESYLEHKARRILSTV